MKLFSLYDVMSIENPFQRRKKIQSDQKLMLKQAKSLFSFENKINQNLAHSPYLGFIIRYVKKKSKNKNGLLKRAS